MLAGFLRRSFGYGCLVVAASVVHAQQVLVIDGGTLIDATRPELAGTATVVIDGGIIRSIGSPDEIDWPADATIIDARGRYVMPGIADMHNHLRSGMFRPGNDQAGVLRSLLDWGVTTTFNPTVPADEFAALRAIVAADPGAYPRTFLIRGVFTTEAGWGNGYKPTTAAAARAIVREIKESGSDGVKLMYDDMRWATTRPFAVMERPIAAAIIDEAHQQGMLAVAHAPILELAKQVLEDGIDCLVHGIISEPVDAEFIELMQRNGACYISTLTMFQTNAGYGEWADRMEAFDLEERLDSQALAIFHKVPTGTARLDNTGWTVERLPVLRRNLLAVRNAGVPILIGTDTGIPGVLPGIAAQLEMVMHVEAGLTPAEVLQAATATAAGVMGQDGVFGTLAVGAQADLLVLDADPRDAIENIRRIRHVIRAGTVVRSARPRSIRRRARRSTRRRAAPQRRTGARDTGNPTRRGVGGPPPGTHRGALPTRVPRAPPRSSTRLPPATGSGAGSRCASAVSCACARAAQPAREFRPARKRCRRRSGSPALSRRGRARRRGRGGIRGYEIPAHMSLTRTADP